MLTAYTDGFPAAPNKEDKKGNNVDNQGPIGKKKASVSHTSSTKSKSAYKESGGGASRSLNEILDDPAIVPATNLFMEPSDQEETIEIG